MLGGMVIKIGKMVLGEEVLEFNYEEFLKDFVEVWGKDGEY